MPSTAVVKTADYKLYERKMELVRSSFIDAQEKTKLAWWTLWEIDQEELYAKAHGYSKTDWVKELATHEGVSQGDFYKVMKLIRNLKGQRISDEKIQDLLGKQMTALKVDLMEAFDKNGKLLPEAEAKIRETYGTFGRMVNALDSQGPGEARKSVGELLDADQISYLEGSAFYNPQRHELLANVRWDSQELGLVGIYTVKVTVTNITEGVVIKEPKHLPERLARWLGSKFGFKV